ASELRTQVAGPQASCLDLRLERADETAVKRMVDVEGALQDQVERFDLLADKGVDPGELFGEVGVGLEFPGHGRSPVCSVSGQGSAAVDDDGLPDDVGRERGGQEERRAGDLLGSSQPL